jgi:DNA-binding NarL/FixJ family response regulator
MSDKVRILVVDDHELVRRGLKHALETRPGWTVCGEASNGREAVALANKLVPDVVIMDLTMPELNGLEATRRIRKDLPDTEILILTMHESEQLMHEVLRCGARGFILKSDAGNVIFDAVDRLRRHKEYFTSKVSDVLVKAYLNPEEQVGAPEALTAREREIVQLIAEGASTKEIASVLGISVKTADTHRANLMRKLDIHSVSEIVRYAIRNRMIAP